jgi:hypothetical protein
MLRNIVSFYGEELLAPSPNLQAKGARLVGCPRLIIQYIQLSTSGGLLLRPQPEDASCCGDRDSLVRAGLRVGPAGQLPGAPTNTGHKDVIGIIGNMVLVNSSFHTRKNLSESYPHFRHAHSKMFYSPVLGRKSLKNACFNKCLNSLC